MLQVVSLLTGLTKWVLYRFRFSQSTFLITVTLPNEILTFIIHNLKMSLSLNNRQVFTMMSCWSNIIQVQAKAYKVDLPSLLTDTIHWSFHPTLCRFIIISVSFTSNSLISRLLPCPVISRRSASSKNSGYLARYWLLPSVHFLLFSQHLFLLLTLY